MSNIIRETDKYELIEGTGPGAGCFHIFRKVDEGVTLWDTGTEGIENTEELKKLSDEDFDHYCSQQQFQ